MRSSRHALAGMVGACSIALLASTSAGASDATGDVLATVAGADWNATLEDWRSRRPDVTCRAYHGDSSEHTAEETFCQACRVESEDVVTEWLFYAYADEEPPHCRLYQVQRVFAGAPELPGLDAALSAQLGPAMPDPCDRLDPACGYRSELRRWEHEGLEVVAYREGEHPDKRPELVIRARSAALRATRMVAEKIRAESFIDQFPELVAAELGVRAPAFRDALIGQIDKVIAELQALRDAARASEGPDRHLLVLAADVMAARLAGFYHELRKVPEGLPEGLTFDLDRNTGMLRYRHDLLRSVLQDAPEGTLARELATVALLQMRGVPTGECFWVAPYREVAREGSAFLAAHPDSKFRLDAAFPLAQAYETWWSVSQAREGDSANPAAAREGAEEARRHAIELYSEIARVEPESERARHARFVLPRLRLGIDTNQRKVLCMDDPTIDD